MKFRYLAGLVLSHRYLVGFEFMGMPMEGKIPRSLYFISHDVDFVLYNCYSGDDHLTLVIGNSKLSFREWCEFVVVRVYDEASCFGVGRNSSLPPNS